MIATGNRAQAVHFQDRLFQRYNEQKPPCSQRQQAQLARGNASSKGEYFDITRHHLTHLSA